MQDYKDTLNLPATSFPMKANLPDREPAFLANWQADDIYGQLRRLRAGAKRFILHDGPPYANGHLHCGHALNKILKDFILKSKSMSGYDALFVPGWDCHGLPIELNVEKKLGKSGVDVDATAFRLACRAYAASQIDIQRSEFQRLGILGDWQHPYISMDFHYEANIIRALAKVVENGHLQRGFKPVHWCMDCRSALAEAEVDYEDKTSPSIDVAFVAVHPDKFLACVDKTLPLKRVIVPIWTTTPWTLPANEAVSLHAELNYALVQTSTAYYVLAADLVESVMKRYGVEAYQIVGQVPGQQFEGMLLNHPIDERSVPVVLGEHVTTEAGTGCVHTAPAHGPDDYLVGQRYQLPLTNPVLANGCYASDVDARLAGLFVLKANTPILDILRENEVLLHEEVLHHSYPHCWRHKTPTIFRATPQWFISMDKQHLRDDLLQQIQQVKWIPEWGKARIEKMVANRPDWCVSRQRAWGTPMPLFVHKETQELHPNTVELIEKIATRFEKKGIEAWFELDPAELLGDDAVNYEKASDTLDVWFDSGVSHFCVLQEPVFGLGFPADLYIEGSDQHRGWFNSSLTTSVAISGKAPFKMVLTHGFTVDAEGKKLSKSKGNYVELDKLIQQYGADILRLWVSSSDYRNELTISDEIIKRNADVYRRLRNTARFLLANLFDFNVEQNQLPASEWVELDRYIVQRCQALQAEILTAYENYHFHVIYQKVHHFCAVELGSFYLDIIKDRQYTTPVNSRARRSCQTAMYHILQALTRWLAPILSFTAEEIWQAMPGYSGRSIFFETWYEGWPMMQTVDMQKWQQVQLIRDEVNKALETERKAGAIGSSLAAEVQLFVNDKTQSLLACFENELRFILIASRVDILPWTARPTEAVVNEEQGIAVLVKATAAAKCVRCWHRLDDVGTHDAHPELCGRCIDNVTGHDEQRLFA